MPPSDSNEVFLVLFESFRIIQVFKLKFNPEYFMYFRNLTAVTFSCLYSLSEHGRRFIKTEVFSLPNVRIYVQNG